MNDVEMLDHVAKNIGYSWACIGVASKTACCAFGGSLGNNRYVKNNIYDIDGKPLFLTANYVSIATLMRMFAKQLYAALSRDGCVFVDKKTLTPDMVPEFMIECVLNGLPEWSSDDGS